MPLVVDYSASRRLVVDYSPSRRLIVDYFTYAAHLGASAHRAAHRSSSTTSPPPCIRVPRHVARVITLIVARLVVDYSASCSLVIDNSASRKLVVDYFASAVRPGASARRTARHADRRATHRLSSTTSPTPRVWVPRHIARLIACRQLLRLHHATGCLGTSHGSSCGSLRRSSSTTSPTPRVRVPRHVAWSVTRLIVDYSVRRDFVLWPRWLYLSHAVRRDYLSRGNTSSTSSTPRAATTSSSGRIASTIHLD
jgi:hypothetical protein